MKLEDQLGGGLAEQALGGSGKKALAGAVHEAEAGVLVEGKDGDVDLAHDRTEQHGGFERAEALLAECGAEGVDLAHDFGESIIRTRRAAAHGVVPFAQGAEQVGERLQGEDNALADRDGAAEPYGSDEDTERPLDTAGETARPEEPESDGRAGEGCEDGEQDNAGFVAEARGLFVRLHGIVFTAETQRRRGF